MKPNFPAIVVVLILLGGCGSPSEDEQVSPRTFLRLTCSTDSTAEETVERLRSYPKIAGAIVAANGITQHPFGELVTVDVGEGQAASPKIELIFIDETEGVFVDAKKVGQPTAFDREMADLVLEGASLGDCSTVID